MSRQLRPLHSPRDAAGVGAAVSRGKEQFRAAGGDFGEHGGSVQGELRVVRRDLPEVQEARRTGIGC